MRPFRGQRNSFRRWRGCSTSQKSEIYVSVTLARHLLKEHAREEVLHLGEQGGCEIPKTFTSYPSPSLSFSSLFLSFPLFFFHYLFPYRLYSRRNADPRLEGSLARQKGAAGSRDGAKGGNRARMLGSFFRRGPGRGKNRGKIVSEGREKVHNVCKRGRGLNRPSRESTLNFNRRADRSRLKGRN